MNNMFMPGITWETEQGRRESDLDSGKQWDMFISFHMIIHVELHKEYHSLLISQAKCDVNLNPKCAAAAKSLQSCLTLYDPIDGSPPGSPVPGILQARTLEWIAVSFPNA